MTFFASFLKFLGRPNARRHKFFPPLNLRHRTSLGVEVLESRDLPSLTGAGGFSLNAIEGTAFSPQAVATFQDTSPSLPPPVVIGDSSFESVNVGTGAFNAFQYDPTGSAWTFSKAAGVAGDGSGFTNGNSDAPDGSQVGFLQAAGATISQAVFFSSGSYVLSFQAAQRGNGNHGGQTFEVQVDGTTIGTFNPASTTYTEYDTDSFTVSAGAHTVAFVGLNPLGGDNTAFIDTVSARSEGGIVGDAGFETPVAGTGTYGAFQYNPSGTAWTFNYVPGEYGSGVAGNGSGFTSGNPDAPEGTQVGFLQGAGSGFSQSLDLAAGSYTISFAAAQRGNWQPAGDQTFEVLVDGAVVGTITPSGTGYATYSTDAFTVDAGSHMLSFVGQTSGDSTAFVDQVRIDRATSGGASSFAATINWGDSSTSTGTVIYDAGSNTFSVIGSHTYTEEGSYAVTTTVTSGSDSLTVGSLMTVADAPLFAAAVPLSPDSNGNVSGPVAVFTDANPSAPLTDYSATIDWGDGTVTAGTISVATPLTDPGFETPNVGTGTAGAYASDPAGSAWTFSGSAGLAGNDSAFTSGNPDAPDGTQVGFLQGAGASISQTITLPAGTFTLSFEAAQRGNWNQGGQTFEVEVDGNVVGTFMPAGSNYTSFTTSAFRVAAGSHTISFIGTNPLGGDNTAFIDSVSLGGPTIYQVTGAHTFSNSATFTVNVEVDDVGGSSTTVSSTVVGPTLPLTLTNPGDQSNSEADFVFLPLTVSGGDGVYTYSASGLPDGLTLDQTGLISGTVGYGDAAINGGVFAVTVSVTDNGTTVSESFNWTVAAVPLTLSNPGDQSNFEGDDVSVPISASGGESPADTWSATGLPSGLYIDPQLGNIFGFPDFTTATTNGGVYPVTVSVSDGYTTTSQTFTWTITTLPLSLASPGDQSNEGQDVVSLQLIATGGEANAYVFSAAGLPSGLTVDAYAGLISGTLDSSAGVTNGGSWTVTVSATDGYTVASQTFTWTVVNAPLSLTNPGDQLNGEGDSVSLPVVGRGGLSSPYSWSAAGLPAGLSIDSQTGLISGTVDFSAAETDNGNYSVTVSATDGVSTASQTFAWTVIPVPLALANPGDQSNYGEDPVSLQFSASGGKSASYSYAASGLPTGLTIDPQTGLISGTVDASAAETNGGVYRVKVSASDGMSAATQTFTWTVVDVPLTVDNPGDQENAEGDTVSVQVFAQGGQSSPYVFSTSGLPEGLTIDQTGLISGIVDFPDAATDDGAYTVAVSASDGTTTVSQTFTWIIDESNRIVPPIDQLNAEGDTVSFQITVLLGTEPNLVYTASGLPSGLSVDPDTGLISGTIPYNAVGTDGGQFAVTVSVTAGTGTDSQSFVWSVDYTNRILQPDDQANREGDTVRLQVLTVLNPGQLTFSAAGLPDGLNIDPDSGLIFGAISTSGLTQTATTPVTISATGDGVTDTQTINWTILRGTTPQVLFRFNGVLNIEGAFTLFDPTLTTQAPVPVTITLYDPTSGIHDVDLGIPSGLSSLDQAHFQLADGQSATTFMTPLQASRAAGDVVLLAAVDGQAAGQADFGNVSVQMDKDAGRKSDTPAGMPDRIPPRVLTISNLKIGPGLQPGQEIWILPGGTPYFLTSLVTNFYNGNFGFQGADGKLHSDLTVTKAGNYLVPIEGTSQTTPGYAGKLSVILSSYLGDQKIGTTWRSAPFSVAAIPIDWQSSYLAPFFGKNPKGNLAAGIQTQDSWASDSEPNGPRKPHEGGLADLDQIHISEKIAFVIETGVFKGQTHSTSGYDKRNATQFSVDVFAQTVIQFRFPGGFSEWDQAHVFMDARTGAVDMPVPNSGYIILRQFFLDTTDNQWKLEIDRFGAQVSVTAKNIKEKDSTFKTVAGMTVEITDGVTTPVKELLKVVDAKGNVK